MDLTNLQDFSKKLIMNKIRIFFIGLLLSSLAVKAQELELANHEYQNFDIQSIQEFPELIAQQKALSGMNVTIPYKEVIIPFLDEMA